jgi:hypothetical protein
MNLSFNSYISLNCIFINYDFNSINNYKKNYNNNNNINTNFSESTNYGKIIHKENKYTNNNFLKTNSTKLNSLKNSSGIIIDKENLSPNLNLNLTIITINEQANKREFDCKIFF